MHDPEAIQLMAHYVKHGMNARAKTNASSSDSRTRQVITYLLVGGGTALLELVVFSILYRLFGTGAVFANITAVFIATATNFVLNGTVTFKGSSNLARSVVLYAILFIFNTCFSTFTISALTEAGIPAEAVKIATMLCIVIWNFVLYKKVVFK